MKNNTLSVKKLMKNLILRTLRQLYAVSEIIILIRWVTPPPKLKIFNLSFSSVLKFFSFSNSSTLQNLHCFLRFSSLAIYIYMSLCPLQDSLMANSLSWFSAKWMWSDPSPSMLYSTQSIHKFFMCVLFETRSKSSLCPCQLKNLRTELLTYLIQNFRLCRSNYSASHDILIYSPTI